MSELDIYMERNITCFYIEDYKKSINPILESVLDEFDIDLSVGVTEIINGYGCEPHFYIYNSINNNDYIKIIKYLENKFSVKCEIIKNTLMVGTIKLH